MSWSKLNAAEVQAVRMGLHLSIPEAAEWVAGHTNPRSWQRYETGERDVPPDIDAELYARLNPLSNGAAFKPFVSSEPLKSITYRGP